MKSTLDYYKRVLPALSIKQPWAWLIVKRFKNVENRVWKTNYRGKFFIHASKRFDLEGYKILVFNKSLYKISLPEPDEYQYGGIIGIAEIVNCVNRIDNNIWFCGPYGFIIENAESISFIPCKGKLKFFKPELK